MKREYRVESQEQKDVVVTFSLTIDVDGDARLTATNDKGEEGIILCVRKKTGKLLLIADADMAGIETDDDGRILIDE